VGLKGDPLWEVQWHGAAGGRVRRFCITRRRLRWCYAFGALFVIFLLALVGALPVSISGYWQRYTVKAAKQENKRLAREKALLLEQGQELALELATRLDRAARLAWALGVPPPLPESTPPAGEEEKLVAWLLAQSQKLESLGGALASGGQAPCALEALPTGWPLDSPQAVPIGRFGLRLSPFTGQEEPHWGLTLAAPQGTRVLAAGAGKVVYAGTPRERRSNLWTRLGTLLVLDHGGGVLSVYGHLGQALVRVGQTVSRGQVVASVGSSGWTRVSALYFEVRWPLAAPSVPVEPLLLQLALPLPELAQRLQDPTAGLGGTAPPLSLLWGEARKTP